MYLTFQEYTDLGGTITEESTFSTLERSAEVKLNGYTSNRLKTATTMPDEVKELLVEFISLLNANNQTETQVSNYSNGSESVTYVTITDEELNKKFYTLAKEYLQNTELLYRGGGSLDV